MADLQTKSFSQTVSDFAAAVQGGASSLLNFTTGSTLRAFADAIGGVVMWMQGLIMALLASTRLSTATTDEDVDSWLADFGFYRIAANYASGLVTFSRATNTAQAIIPVGQAIQTGDGTQQFVIKADATNAAYSETVITGGGFVIPAGISSITVTATAVTAGTGGNVSAATITQLSSAINYVDTVTNPVGFSNGVDKESNPAVRTRFVAWLNSLAQGTTSAIYAAISDVQQGLSAIVLENTLFSGDTQAGAFTVLIDDGSGYPSSTLLTTISNAINAIRPLCSSFSVHAPSVLHASVAVNISTASGYVHSSVCTIVQTAIAAYINTLAIGAPLSYTKLAQVAYEASPAVTLVSSGYTVNGSTTDLTAISTQVIKTASVTVG